MVYLQSRAKIVDALSSLLEAAGAAGTVRADLDAEDGLLGLVMDGLRYGA